MSSTAIHQRHSSRTGNNTATTRPTTVRKSLAELSRDILPKCLIESIGVSALTVHKNHRIGKIGELLGYVKQYPIAADYSKSPDSSKCHDARSETTGHRHLRRTICRPITSASKKSRINAGTSRRRSWDQHSRRLLLGILSSATKNFRSSENCGGTWNEKGKGHPAERIKPFLPKCLTVPLLFIRHFGKISAIPLAYGRALIIFTKGGVL